MALCATCFPHREWNVKDIVSNLDGGTWWVGYLVCDPKRGSNRSNRYDLFVQETRMMNFQGVPVVFDHNKKRRPLGKVVHAWHDHNFPSTDTFAVAFLAEITNKSLLQTPACVTMMGDTFVSLSTYEHDRTDVVEVSVTFCGARDGCVGMFVPRSRVAEVMNKFGLAPCYYKRHKMVCAKYTMADDMTHSNETGEKEDTLKSVLRQLPESQYNTIIDHMNREQKCQKELIDKMEGYNETVGLLSDYLGSMIQSRMALEQGSDSAMAEKRRKDLQMMKDRGVFDRGCSDLEAIREMVQYCRECFPDGSSVEKEVVDKFCTMFDVRFPQLKDKLQDRGTSLATVDAAFHLIKEEMRDRDVARLHRDKTKLEERKRALALAKKHYDTFVDASGSSASSTTKGTTKSGVQQRDMGFDQFLKTIGVTRGEENDEDDSMSSPPRKRIRKSSHEKHKAKEGNHSYDDDDDDDDFMAYAVEKEKNFQKTKKRYKSYKRDYLEHKQKRQEYQNRQLEELMDCVPTLSKMAKYFDEKMQHSKQENGETNDRPMDQGEVASPSTSSSENKKTVDASLKPSSNDEVTLFDL